MGFPESPRREEEQEFLTIPNDFEGSQRQMEVLAEFRALIADATDEQTKKVVEHIGAHTLARIFMKEENTSLLQEVEKF